MHPGTTHHTLLSLVLQHCPMPNEEKTLNEVTICTSPSTRLVFLVTFQFQRSSRPFLSADTRSSVFSTPHDTRTKPSVMPTFNLTQGAPKK